MKCCGNCKYCRQSKLKIQFNEIPITVYCDNENSPYYNKYVWDDEICDEWKGADLACAWGNDGDNEELEARVDAIIQHGLSELDVPDYSKEFDKFDDETRMMFACIFLINEFFIGKKDKAILREWLKETAMMV